MVPVKRPLCVVTMVYSDYFFLERWYRYYSEQVGAENLYVLSHGNDPRHREIAPDANVINVPREPEMIKFDRRRWLMMSRIASGLLEFYDWAALADVDEILIVDPDRSTGLVSYIQDKFPHKRNTPKNICPLGLQMIHVPKEEPLEISSDDTILARRRHFYPSRVYSKPCLFGAPAQFGPGGHRNDLGKRFMDPDLYLLHLNFFDLPRLEARAAEKRAVTEAARMENADFPESHPWDSALEQYHRIMDTYHIGGEDVALPKVRAALSKQREKYSNQYVLGKFAGNTLYKLPARFQTVF